MCTQAECSRNGSNVYSHFHRILLAQECINACKGFHRAWLQSNFTLYPPSIALIILALSYLFHEDRDVARKFIEEVKIHSSTFPFSSIEN